MSFIEDRGWYAHVHASFPQGTARLILFREGAHGQTEVVNTDGTATVHPPGERLPENIGWEVPIDGINAIAKAIERYQGDTGHAATEVRVLREWLQEERGRVDQLLRWATNAPS